ncbi:hypothetical protein ACEQUB_p00269 (plasmid) [Ralstonia syzygii]
MAWAPSWCPAAAAGGRRQRRDHSHCHHEQHRHPRLWDRHHKRYDKRHIDRYVGQYRDGAELHAPGPAAHRDGLRPHARQSGRPGRTLDRRLECADRQWPHQPVAQPESAGGHLPRRRRRARAELRDPLQRHRGGLRLRAALEGLGRHGLRGQGRAVPGRLVVDADADRRRHQRGAGGRHLWLRIRQRGRDHAQLRRMDSLGPGGVPEDDAQRLLPDQPRLPEPPQQHRGHALLGQLGPVQPGVGACHRRAVRRRRPVQRGHHVLQERRGQRLHRTGGLLRASGLPGPMAGDRPRPGPQHAGHRAGRRHLRDGMEPGHRPVRVRQQPLPGRRRIRGQGQPDRVRQHVLHRALRHVPERGRGADGVLHGRAGHRAPVLGAGRQPLHQPQGAGRALLETVRGADPARGRRRQLRPQQRRLRPARLRHAHLHARRRHAGRRAERPDRLRHGGQRRPVSGGAAAMPAATPSSAPPSRAAPMPRSPAASPTC